MKNRSEEVVLFRRKISGSHSSESVQLTHEIKQMDCHNREDLLKTLDIPKTTVSSQKILALKAKANLAIPWNKLRVMRRYVLVHVLVCTTLKKS